MGPTLTSLKFNCRLASEVEYTSFEYTGVGITGSPFAFPRPQVAYKEYESIKRDSIRKLQLLKKKLETHITKTEPFVEVWRKAKEVCSRNNTSPDQFNLVFFTYSFKS